MRDNEKYIIDMCDLVLKQKSYRQHTFDFLKGDTGRKLPVDAYYPLLNLVIEFHERQHTGPVPFFDRRITASGVSRGIQRRIYDQRRRNVLPKYGIKLVEFSINEFPHKNQRKLIQQPETNRKIIYDKLKHYINA